MYVLMLCQILEATKNIKTYLNLLNMNFSRTIIIELALISIIKYTPISLIFGKHPGSYLGSICGIPKDSQREETEKGLVIFRRGVYPVITNGSNIT